MSLQRAAFTVVFLVGTLRAGAAQVTMSASTATATVGERIELRVIVRAEPGVKGMRLEIPNGDYEIVGRKTRSAGEAAGGGTFEEIVTITFFKTGDFAVGPFEVELLPRRADRPSEFTGKLTVHVRSLLSADDKDIQPLKEPLALRGDPRHLLPYAAMVLLLLLLVAVVVMLRRKLQRKKKLAAEPPLPPEVELEQGIRELRGKNLWQAGEFRQFFIALSAMLKRFIERAYGFNAEECTTIETVAGLKPREADAAIVAGLEEILTQADLVKFARLVPADDVVTGIWGQIDAIIAEHKKRRRLAEEAARVSSGR